MPRKNPFGREIGSPKAVRNGWLVPTNDRHAVPFDKSVAVPATYIEGGLANGVWINDAGCDGNGQDSFKICGDPDFLLELAEALRLISEQIRSKSGNGWARENYDP